MSDKLVRIKDLPSYIDGLREKLREMNYSEGTISSTTRILLKFCKYAEETNCEFYDSFTVQNFIIINNGDDYDDKYYSHRLNRPFVMLNDFVNFNNVTRQKYWNACDFKEGYAEYFKPFIEHLMSRNFAEGSIKACRSHLLRFQHYLLDNGIASFVLISHEAVSGFCDMLAVYSTTTTCQITRDLKKLFEYSMVHGVLTEDYSKNLPKYKNTRGQKLPDKFTAEEIAKIIDAIDTNNPLGKRDYAIVLTAVRLGLRNCDVTTLKFSSIDWNKKEIHLIQQKTGVPLTLPLPEDVGWAIINYIKNGRPKSDSNHIFVGHNVPFKPLTEYTNFVAIYMRKAGLYVDSKRKIGMHTLRRTLATSMLENGVPVTIISQTLGHGDLNSVGNYIRISTKLLKKCAMEVTDFE